MREHHVVLYLAPIPVGHRVELHYHRVTQAGLLGSRTRDWPYDPRIVDLDTGVEYASDRVYLADDMRRPYEPARVADQPAGEVVRVVRGRVVACRVIHVRSYAEFDVQTDLMIETES